MENKPLEEYQPKTVNLDLSKAEKKYTQITCPSCNGEVPASNLQLDDKIAKCGSCNAVFSIQDEISGLMKASPAKKEMARPAGIDMYHFHDDLDITIKQPLNALDAVLAGSAVLFFLLFCLIYFAKGEMFWGMPISLAVGVYPFFQLANRHKHFIYMDINQHFLNVKWRPKKFYSDISISTQELSQVYVKFSATTNQAILYGILDTAEGQKHVKLLSEITGTKARYLEQEIERHLGIEDYEVPEETR